jgi:hypothetical protein
MSALAEDSRNDVASNIVALACGLIGMISSFYTLIKSLLNSTLVHIDYFRLQCSAEED